MIAHTESGMFANKLTDKEVNHYRDCFINGLITVEQIVKETGIHPNTVSALLRNKLHTDETYQKALDKVINTDLIQFSLPVRPKYEKELRNILTDYSVPVEERHKIIKERLCDLTYNTQTATFIVDDEGNKHLLIIENKITTSFGYLLPPGKYKIELILEADKRLFTRFVYEPEDRYRIIKTRQSNDYWVTCDGRVVLIRRGVFAGQSLNRKGYLKVNIFNKETGLKQSITVHRLVAEGFVPNPLFKPQVNHKDGIKINNDYTNLEWVTNQENQDHAWKTGLNVVTYDENASAAKLTNAEVREIRLLFLNKEKTPKQLSELYGVSTTAIFYIVMYKSYPNATDPNEIPPYVPIPKSEMKGEKSINAVFSDSEVREMRKLYKEGKCTVNELARKHNVHRKTIYSMLIGKTYRNVTD